MRGRRGFWNSVLTARVAERLVYVEEVGMGVEGAGAGAGAVKREDRVAGVELGFEMEPRRAFLRYRKCYPFLEGKDIGGMETVEEWVEW